MTIWDDLRQGLEQLSAAGLYRRERVIDSACGPRVTLDGRLVVCFCGNDYLGLADDPAIKQAAIDAIARWGVGAGASRLVSGTSRPHAELEAALAEFKRAPAAVVTATGWMANHAAVHALVGPGDLVLCDKLNHASIIDACRSCGGRQRTYGHGDVRRLEELLTRERGKHRRCLIVTDSLFSMDGDLAPLLELVSLKKKYDALLVIDEAHATGVFGEGGRGVAEHLGVEGEIDATVGTLSKAIGAMGGFVAGPVELIETIRNTGRPYIYTTALPPAVCAAALKALEIIAAQPHRRQRLLAMAAGLRRRLTQAGIDTGGSCSQIIPAIAGRADRALRISQALLDDGFLIPAIRPPTVPKDKSRLRISLSAGHTDEDVTRLAAAVERAFGDGKGQTA